MAARHVEQRRGEQRGGLAGAGAARRRRVVGGRPTIADGDGVEDRVLQVGDHVAVRRDGALGPAGRAARVEDDGVVALVDARRRGTSGSASAVSSSKRCRRGSPPKSAGSASMRNTASRSGSSSRCVGDPLEAAPVGDEHLGAAVLQAVEDLVGLPPAVEARPGWRPRSTVRPEGQAPLGVVGRQHGHPVAVADAEPVVQRGRRRVGQPEELGEADAPVAVDDERLLVAPQRGDLGDGAEVGEPVLVDLHLERRRSTSVGHLERPRRARSGSRGASASVGMPVPLSADSSSRPTGAARRSLPDAGSRWLSRARRPRGRCSG